jgi:hypothetical protein
MFRPYLSAIDYDALQKALLRKLVLIADPLYEWISYVARAKNPLPRKHFLHPEDNITIPDIR